MSKALALRLNGCELTSLSSDVVEPAGFSSSSLSEHSLRRRRRRGLKTGEETSPLLVERDLDCELSDYELSGCTGTIGNRILGISPINVSSQAVSVCTSVDDSPCI